MRKHHPNPPTKKKRVGKLKKLRKRSLTEPPAGVKMEINSIKMTCKHSGKIGHNKRTCKAALPGKASS